LFTPEGRSVADFGHEAKSRPEGLPNDASSLCGAHRHNNEATSQWKGIVMDILVVTLAFVSLYQIKVWIVFSVDIFAHIFTKYHGEAVSSRISLYIVNHFVETGLDLQYLKY